MISITDSNRDLDSKWMESCESGFDSLLARKDLGFQQLHLREENWSSVVEVSRQIENKFKSFVFVGIGGSSLGGRTVKNAFVNEQTSKKIQFLENVDITTFQSVVSQIDLSETCWVFVSKSGGTLETLALANQVTHELRSNGLGPKGRTVVITEKKPSALYDWALSVEAIVLEIPLDVGGRFSVLTPVGLLPAALLGLNIEDMRKGAAWAVEQKDLICQLGAHAFASFERQEFVTQFWPYSDRLSVFGSWIQQLWAESLAKKTTLNGKPPLRVSTPMACLGAVDQHSLLQQVMEGAKDKFVCYFKVLDSGVVEEKVENQFSDATWLSNHTLSEILNIEQRATKTAMKQVDVSFLEVSFQDLQPKSLAAGFMVYQLLIGVMGEVMEIDAFDQPGVELGKGLAKKIL